MTSAAGVEGASRASFRYAGFISYNRGVDLDLSADLQRALHRFAKPWYQLRALRIFRDVEALAANPAAWAAVEQGLAESEYLILLASPQAAASKWVRREIGYWLAHKPHDKILIAWTGGELVWDDGASDYDWQRTTALPADVLRGVFAQEPNYVDLRPVKILAGRPRARVFEGLVADLAAPLHHRSKDDMISEDRKVYRRNRRLAFGAVSALVALTTASVLFAVQARLQTREADRQRRVAISRQLAAQSNLIGDSDPQLSGLLAAAAWRVNGNDQAREAMVSALARPGRRVLTGHTGPVKAVVFSPDGKTVATASDDKTARLWNAATGQPITTLTGHTEILVLAGATRLPCWHGAHLAVSRG